MQGSGGPPAGDQSALKAAPRPAVEEDPFIDTAYRMVRLLGSGGMGDVFEAEHRALGNRVVVKVMRQEHATRIDMRDRMRVEAQALARIRHPNLVLVTDFGHTKSGRPFVVMERLFGRSLRQELEARGVMPIADALEVARQALLGLSAAHEAGVVHRDIKPDNVFLCDRGPESEPSPRLVLGGRIVKVLDFGVAKIVAAGRDPRTPAPPLVPTEQGVSLGTPRYFSPEQARGVNDLDARADLYAVGLLLYAMIVGRGPFDHVAGLQELFRAHAHEAPLPPSACAPQPVPAAVEKLIMKALSKPREERFATALHFAREIVRAATGGAGSSADGWTDTLPIDSAGLVATRPDAGRPGAPHSLPTPSSSFGPATTQKAPPPSVSDPAPSAPIAPGSPSDLPTASASPVRPGSIPGPAAQAAAPATVPMFEVVVPRRSAPPPEPAPPASAPRSGVPKTLQDVTMKSPVGRPAAPIAPPPAVRVEVPPPAAKGNWIAIGIAIGALLVLGAGLAFLLLRR